MIDVISFARSGLAEGLYILHKEEFSASCYMSDTYTSQIPSLLIRDNSLLASEDIR
jgi:hypothetical protein